MYDCAVMHVHRRSPVLVSMNTPRSSPQAWKIQNDPLSIALSGPVLRLPPCCPHALPDVRHLRPKKYRPRSLAWCWYPELIRGSIIAFSWQRLMSHKPCCHAAHAPMRVKS